MSKPAKRHFAWMPYDKDADDYWIAEWYPTKKECKAFLDLHPKLSSWLPVRVEIIPVVREKKAEKPAKSIFPLQVGKTYETEDRNHWVLIVAIKKDFAEGKWVGGSYVGTGNNNFRLTDGALGGCPGGLALVREVTP